jgi:phosphate uptake regulator
MTFKVVGSEPLVARLQLRLTAGEKQRVVDDAELAGLTVSEFIRRRALGRPVLAAIDLQMQRELHRIGGLLKHVHNESRGAYSSLTAAMLGELRDCIHQIDQATVSRSAWPGERAGREGSEGLP